APRQVGEEPADFEGAGVAVHDEGHGFAHFRPAERGGLFGALQVGGEHAHDQWILFRKLRSMSWPCSVAMLSGWNCTLWTGLVLWARPMMRPSSLSAVISSSAGNVSRSTISE